VKALVQISALVAISALIVALIQLEYYILLVVAVIVWIRLAEKTYGEFRSRSDHHSASSDGHRSTL
jgi:hypothetical protein